MVRSARRARQLRHSAGRSHEFVNGIIILPNSGQARAKLKCELSIVASGPGLPLDAGYLSPPAPRRSERIGPALAASHVLQVSVKFSVKPALEFRVWFKPNTSGRLKAGPFFVFR